MMHFESTPSGITKEQASKYSTHTTPQTFDEMGYFEQIQQSKRTATIACQGIQDFRISGIQ